ncbi:WD domain, G-beta repeat protein [Dictyocaulus viviparus]|uniref:WD domain, G-beta repeat protein n=1 Tax=Dictyocaulus viviparus TaxID=29172 RepID=A0A0D8XUX8_DICVI|nr:WD domain, G-beta repeat protein [Dictyocaulus viviparus]
MVEYSHTMNLEDMDIPTLLSILVGVLIVMSSSFIYLTRKQKNQVARGSEEFGTKEVGSGDIRKSGREKKSRQGKNDHWKTKVKDVSYDHVWSVTTLKGHTSKVTGIDFAQDGKKFVSVSSDRCVFLWDVRDFEEKEHKCISHVLDFDTATKVSFSPDSRSMVFAMKRLNKKPPFKCTEIVMEFLKLLGFQAVLNA